MSGLEFFLAGLTPQTDQALYSVLALLSGAIGAAVGSRVMGAAIFSHLVAWGLGLWLFNLSGVLLGTQTFAGWLDRDGWCRILNSANPYRQSFLDGIRSYRCVCMCLVATGSNRPASTCETHRSCP
jgi:hypothetical protein